MSNLVIREDGRGAPRTSLEGEAFPDRGERRKMLFTLSAVFFVLWGAGMLLPFAIGSLLHLLFAMALVLLVVGATQGREASHPASVGDRVGWTSVEQDPAALTRQALQAKMEQQLKQWSDRLEALQVRVDTAGADTKQELQAELAEFNKLSVVGKEYLKGIQEISQPWDEVQAGLIAKWTHLSEDVDRIWARVEVPMPAPPARPSFSGHGPLALVLAVASLGAYSVAHAEGRGEQHAEVRGGQHGAAPVREAPPTFRAHPGGIHPRGATGHPHAVRVLAPRVLVGGGHPWTHWEHPEFSRPAYYWEWSSVRRVSCIAEDSYGDQYPVSEATYSGFGFANMTGVEDDALDRCYAESGQDASCYLATCSPG